MMLLVLIDNIWSDQLASGTHAVRNSMAIIIGLHERSNCQC